MIGEAAGRLHARGRATIRWRPTSGCGCATPSTRWIRPCSALQTALIEQAEVHADAVMPGFTHLQAAQPVTLGHHLLAYVEMLGRDRGRFADCAAPAQRMPVGRGGPGRDVVSDRPAR